MSLKHNVTYSNVWKWIIDIKLNVILQMSIIVNVFLRLLGYGFLYHWT